MKSGYVSSLHILEIGFEIYPLLFLINLHNGKDIFFRVKYFCTGE